MWLPSISIPSPSPTLLSGVLCISAAAGGAYAINKFILQRLCYIGKDEQLLLKELTHKRVINGPAVIFPSYLSVLSYKKRKAEPISSLQYALVEDTETGARRMVPGPTLLFLGAYETIVDTIKPKVILGPKQGLYVINSSTGAQTLVKGPTTFIPTPEEQVDRIVEPYTLSKSEYVKLRDNLTGEVWIEKGPILLYLEPQWKLQEGPLNAFSLKSHQYIRLRDTLTGAIRVEKGEKTVFPSAFETPCDSPSISDAIDLKAWEYVMIQDRKTGRIFSERGEKLIFLGATEQLLYGSKQSAVKVDEECAALVRSLSTGALRLIDTPQLFFPSEDEEVVEIRSKIKLADNEAVVLKDGQGRFHFRYGDPARGSEGERSFFIPPYWELVTQIWSRGRRRERRDLAITTFDMRAQFMSFEFNCRTSDNVEMILEGTFFWEVVDLEAMLRSTGDASGDVCAHARSCFIALVSKVTLQMFMDSFNEIARQAHSNDDSFYVQRGVKIHTLEVTRYQCADTSTAMILQEIIQETTNRMNRLSCQESENEVALAKLKGVVEQERANSEVLQIQHEHEILTAKAQGHAEAERVLAFLSQVNATSGALSNKENLAVDLWHELRRGESLAKVAQGSAHVYFTPQDAHLTIESK